MYEQFTDAAKRVIHYAHHQVCRQKGGEISAAYLLFGVVLTDSGRGCEILQRARVDAASVRHALQRIYGLDRGNQKCMSGTIAALDCEAKRVIECAQQKARSLRSITVTPDHILWGIVVDDESSAILVFEELEVDVDAVRASLKNYFHYQKRRSKKNKKQSAVRKKHVACSERNISRPHRHVS